MIFRWNIHFESSILALFDKGAKLGKASRDNCNWGGWLILLELLKNWVAKGSEVHDFNLEYLDSARGLF
jgi:hypothetical protein